MNVEKRMKQLEWVNGILLVSFIGMGIIFYISNIKHVKASDSLPNIVANSIKTHSLTVDNPTGKQGITMAVGDDGMVVIGLNNVNGHGTIDMLTESDGKASLCVAYKNICRIVVGNVYRGTKDEFSIQLRNDKGKSIWMPPISNPVLNRQNRKNITKH